MSDQVKLTAFATAECEARTIGDLRALLRWCDKYRVADDAGLDWGMGTLFVDITGDSAVPASWIECGDHLVGDEHWDVLIDTHTHPYRGPETYEEAREEALERVVCVECGISSRHVDFGHSYCEPCATDIQRKPARYDWPARDRYGDGRMPG